MKKITKIGLISKGIIGLKKEFVPQVILKKQFKKKLINGVPDTVFKAHINCVYGCEDIPILDPLLFFPAFAKDPNLAVCQLLESIRENVDDDDIRSFIHKKDLETFLRILERSGLETNTQKGEK